MRERPYEPLGMTTAKWQEIAPSQVTVSDLTISQDNVSISGLFLAMRGERSYSGDYLPHVVRHEGRLWLVDGHHRYVIAAVRGDEFIQARVKDQAA